MTIASKVRPCFRGAMEFAVALAIVGCMLLLLLRFRYQTLGNALAYMKGERIIVSTEPADLRVESNAKHYVCNITLTNVFGRPAKLFQVESACPCVRLEDELPIEIAPDASQVVTASVSYNPTDIGVDRELLFYLDNGRIEIAQARIKSLEGQE